MQYLRSAGLFFKGDDMGVKSFQFYLIIVIVFCSIFFMMVYDILPRAHFFEADSI